MTKVTQDDIEKIEKSATNLYHLLRHYPKLDTSYTDKLIGQEYEYYDYKLGKYVPSVITETDIRNAYATEGSKFFLDVEGMETPDQLIDTIKQKVLASVEKNELEWTDEEQYRKVEHTYVCSKDIGYRGVVSINELSDEDKQEIKQKPRGKEGVLINVAHINKQFPTNQLAIGLYERFDTGKLYITAFPGEVGWPSLPSAEQSDEKRQASEAFWSQMVFVS